MKPIIPPELWDGIIDNLHDDKSTLCKCSLVCRFWLWSSQAHLFYTLALTPLDIDTALSLLFAPGSTIPPHVRALKMFTILHGLKSLMLVGMTFDILGQALQLICSAPSLERLSLRSMDFHSTETSLTNFRAPAIKHVAFRWHYCSPVIIDWLCHRQPTPSIRNLAFDEISGAGIPSISAYIRRLGPALEHLKLQVLIFAAALHKELDLTHSTSLKSISTTGVILYNESLRLPTIGSLTSYPKSLHASSREWHWPSI